MAELGWNGVLGPLVRRFGRSAVEALPDQELLARFVRQHDQAAFTALVRRHGGMVSSICQRALGNREDAEDAFQATFLVLARKAGSLQQPQRLANWLYGVAVRLARKARAAAARRQARARPDAPMASIDPSLAATRDEVRQLLDSELERLPEKYRSPLVLCYLEGRSRDAAAAQLGCSESTLKGQLERARELLRRRLAGRGVAGHAGLPAMLEHGMPALAPDAWIARASRAAVGLARGGTMTASPGALALAQGLMMTHSWASRLVIAGSLAVLLSGMAAGARLGTAMGDEPRPAESRSNVAAVPDWPPPRPRMVPQGQLPALDGGTVVLYSRWGHGNYPLATYAFHLGLRGDDASVANDVNLVFGNARRGDRLPDEPVDRVPGVLSHGAVGRDAFGPANRDEFRVTCLAGSRHRIIDLGTIDHAALAQAPRALEAAADDRDADTVAVQVDHVYAIRLQDPEHEQLKLPRYLKLRVLDHRENDAVRFIWAPIKPR